MPTMIVYAVLALAIMGAVGTGVYKVKKWGGDEVRAEWNAANEAQRKKEAEASAKAAADLAAERAKRKVITKERTVYVDKIVDRPVYRNVCLDTDGLQCLGTAIRGEDASGCKPSGGLPTTPPPH